MKRIKKLIVASFALVLIATSTMNVSAEKYSFSKATHTSSWNDFSEKNSAKENLFKTKRTDVFTRKYRGTIWKTKYYATTDNYYHVKGASDIKITKVKQWTNTLSCSVSADVKAFGAEIGGQTSISSSKGIEHSVAASCKSGDYYYGVACQMRDLRVYKKTTIYKKKNGKYVFSEQKTSDTKGCVVYGGGVRPLYYKWNKV